MNGFLAISVLTIAYLLTRRKYASDGVTFVDQYTWTGSSTSILYLNIVFQAFNKNAYYVKTNGFIK